MLRQSSEDAIQSCFRKQDSLTSPIPEQTVEERTPDSIPRWSSAAFLSIFTLFYFSLTFAHASIKLLWFDELITFYVARLNAAGPIWDALARGTDPNPPLMHLLVMWSIRLFGESELAVRLPAILANWVAAVCLFVFLRRRLPVQYAAAGVCFFVATGAFSYSYESRSYALLLAFCIGSLVAWRGVVEGKRPAVSAVLLALCVALGISSNYFAVLSVFPIAVGELVRSIQRRRIDYRVWLALTVGVSPLLVYMPLIDYAAVKFGPYAFNRVQLNGPLATYLRDPILWPSLGLIIYCAVTHVRKRLAREDLIPAVLPRHEIAAVVVLIAYPLIGYVVASFRGGMLSPRFVLPVAYGFAIAVAVVAYRLFSRRYTHTIVFLVLLASWITVRHSIEAYIYLGQRSAFERVRDNLPAEDTIVVPDGLLVLPLYHYSRPEIASRLVFPVDFDAVRRYKREDGAEQNLWAGRGSVFPLRIVSLQELEATTRDYLVVCHRGNWLLEKYAADGLPARRLPIEVDTTRIWTMSHGSVFYFEAGTGGTVARRLGAGPTAPASRGTGAR